MLAFSNPETVYRTVPPKDSRPQKRPQLVATWHTVNGKLVCHWVPVRSSLEQ
ncbi:MAG: hypothetical protein AAFR24_16965 [Cyanobacteria bacterium J06627_3]